ncbi:hypothetical protein CH260_20225 [Rhodococcus sp. 05-2256-B2]|uniref:phthiocerol/phthiodiolone dimycocerosyl transferase family protein n=1 Tax=unclassified Rhodococcus (in: high G+C Gram-positive bacteria) TaxID=192944 RepID=UPI000B9AD366|nr:MULTISPECIES: hypothetical protein [unclassified Rhodococcus (in: high G+C Gram-positive bacteria)]OZD85276.1 hypothetical protein CH258_13755 [Rhodococcus sp. 05-2256-B4]OZD92422.1 hypothetical protein CH260_20225 [Rhodococcus sp. 05-2256-B2]OZD99352.1 hypothetical protein CH257_00875 [Rhodococcus sp. 05-2256-B3]OZE02876.1 hypothetical protein CH285_12990 [Rhodococcus sp. 05-2256-B1]
MFTLAAGVHTGYGVRAEGHLSLDALIDAFSALTDTHWFLKGAIQDAEESTGRVFALAEDDVAVVSVVGGSPTSGPLDGFTTSQDSALCALHIVRLQSRHHLITLITHHSIADARHSLMLLSELWTLYTALAQSHILAGERPRHSFPSAIEVALRERGISGSPRQARNPASQHTAVTREPDADATANAPEPVNAPTNGSETVRCQLTSHETQQLTALGRDQGVTLNQLVSAAILQAAAAVRGVNICEVVYAYVVDIRSRVSPTIEYTEVTTALGYTIFQASPPDQSLLELARAIGTALQDDLAAGAIQRWPLGDTEEMFATLESTRTLVMTTNWGTIPELTVPPDLDFTEFLPSTYVGAGTYAPAWSDAFITTFGGKLAVDFWGGPPQDGNNMATALRSVLRSHLSATH